MINNGFKRVTRCQSCLSEIRWAKWASGKAHPVNAEAVTFRDSHRTEKRFTLCLIKDGVIENVLEKKQCVVGQSGYRSHFETCPHAPAWRREAAPEKPTPAENKTQGMLL